LALMQLGAGSGSRIFADRAAAGRELARRLEREALRPPVIVLGLPRGGVAVAQPVACALRAPLDVLVVRKIGMPMQPEFAIGAIAAGGIVVRDPPAAHRGTGWAEQGDEAFERLGEQERRELERREAIYRAGRPPLDLKRQTAVLVDDGLATGSTMVAAVRAARRGGARTIIAAAPVASPQALERVSAEADEAIMLEVPDTLFSIGEWYDRFEQLSDAEVMHLLTDRGE
jgi:putative phosphoribosyl transferase